MLSGRPTTSPATLWAALKALSASRSLVNLLRRMVSAGPAKLQPASHSDKPMVLVPTSRPVSTPASGKAAAKSATDAVIKAATPPASARHRGGRRSRTERNRRRGNCCRAARRDPWPEWRRRAAGSRGRSGRRPGRAPASRWRGRPSGTKVPGLSRGSERPLSVPLTGSMHSMSAWVRLIPVRPRVPTQEPVTSDGIGRLGKALPAEHAAGLVGAWRRAAGRSRAGRAECRPASRRHKRPPTAP